MGQSAGTSRAKGSFSQDDSNGTNSYQRQRAASVPNRLAARFSLGFGLALAAGLLGCGAPEEEPVAQSEHFVFWDPGTALVNEHLAWHQNACAAVAGAPGAISGRRCTLRGEDFLLFHHHYLLRLRQRYEALGLTANIAPWYSLPAEMKSTANGWTTALQTAETNILNFKNASGVPFTSLDAFGLYLETFYHNSLHGIARNAYGGVGCTSDTTDCVVRGFMSPKSTYFFKIHGLIEWHLSRFSKGDFNRDGMADLLLRNSGSGANSIRLMNGQMGHSTVATASAPIDACQWYPGAVIDLNFDGWNDIIWHGPGCNAVSMWRMSETTRLGSVDLPGVNSDWVLSGAGDFTGDTRPDLVWRQLSTGDLNIWQMNGTSYVTSHIFTPGPFQNTYVIDFHDNGTPDFIFRSFDGSSTYRVQSMTGLSWGSSFLLSGMSGSPYDSPGGIGRYGSERFPDLAMMADAPVANPKSLTSFFQMNTGASSTMTTVNGGWLGIDWYLRGPR